MKQEPITPPDRTPDVAAPAPPTPAPPDPADTIRDLTTRLAATEADLAKAKAATEAADLRRRVERALADAGAIDVDVACVLTENAIAAGKKTVADTVADLRKSKPFLFRGTTAPVARSSAMSALPPTRHNPLTDLADTAKSGDRGSLLRYLRAKRAR